MARLRDERDRKRVQLNTHLEKNDWRRAAQTLMALGEINTSGQEPAAAVTCFDQARRYFLQIGDTAGVAEAECQLAGVLGDLGKLEEAEKYCRSSLTAFESLNDRPSVAVCQGQLGILALRSGRWNEAASCLIDAATQFHAQGTGDRLNLCLFYFNELLKNVDRGTRHRLLRQWADVPLPSFTSEATSGFIWNA
jgi:tetratricopeptide (TPR) repeat protein